MKNLSIGNKIIIGVAIAVAVSTLAGIATVQYLASKNRVESLRHEMSGLLAQSETMIENMDAMHKASAFDQPQLLALAKKQIGDQPLKKAYAKTAFYQTIPVVAAWKAAAESARKNGYEFFTPSHPRIPARNPKNNNGADFAEAFKAFESGQPEYFHEDKKGDALVLARPIFYNASCLSCHGSPAKSPTKDGLDILGFPMEDAKLGELKGAFVLKTKLSNDPVVAATVKTMAGVGIAVLGVVVAIFWMFNSKFLIKPLKAIISQLGNNAVQTGSAAAQIANSSQTAAEGASEQAASLEETSASLEEIAAMTKRNAENAASTKNLSQQACDSAVAGLERISEMHSTLTTVKVAVGEMESAVSEMQSSSHEIAKIIKTIDEIAFQTNLLALNAAVEAARAGEAGAGFAVVADEVRSLAQRSAQAAKDTSEKIEAAVKRSALGGTASEKVVKRLGEIEGNACNIEQVFNGIVTQIKSLDKIVGEISSASTEQNQGIGEVNVAVSQMDKVTQSNAATAEENAGAAEELNAQVSLLQDIVGSLQTVVIGGRKDAPAATAAETSSHKPPKPERTSPKPFRPKLTEIKHSKPNGKNGHGEIPMPELAGADSRNGFKDF